MAWEYVLSGLLAANGLSQCAARLKIVLTRAQGLGLPLASAPTMRMLALSFLILIGVMLVAEGMGRHIERGYAYVAMAFSMGVELLNLRMRAGAKKA